MIKKRKFFVIAILVIFLVMVIAFLLGKQQSKKEVSLPFPQGVEYKGFLPGKSTREEIVDILGSPVEEKQQEGGSLLLFNSNSPTTNHEAVFQENVLTFFKEIVTNEDEKDIAFLTSQYGEASYVLFGPASVGGFDLYVYPEKGLAYIGNPHGNTLLEIWYFPPTTFEEFRSNYAIDYRETLEPRNRF